MFSFLNIVPSLESLLKNAQADSLTDNFGIILMLIFIFSLLCFILQIKKSQNKFFINIIEYSPVLLTSVGILGTFTGIVAGLLNFDINNIDTSISTLLAGMKTAFLSSVIGVALSIILKIIYSFPISKKTNKQKIDIPVLIETFNEQANHIKIQTENIKEQNDTIKLLTGSIIKLDQSIGGDADNSLLSQMKLLRNDLTDNNRSTKNLLEKGIEHIQKIKEDAMQRQQRFDNFETLLWKKLDNFAEMMSKSATEQVIEALKQVISDFNNNLIEQFGDNFKQLNLAVLSLITWQDNYKNQLNEMIQLYNLGVNTLSSTEKSITHIEQSTQEIPKTMDKLSDIITVNQHQLQELENHLTTFAELKNKAVEAVPQIQSNIELMLSGLSEGNKKLIEGISESGEHLHQNISKGSELLYKNIDNVSERIKDSTAILLDKNQEIQKTFENIQGNLYSTFEKLMQQHILQAENNLSNIEKHNQKIMSSISDSNQELQKNFENTQDNLYSTFEKLMQQHILQAENNLSNIEKHNQKIMSSISDSSQELQKKFENTQGNLYSTFEKLMQQHTLQAENNLSNIEKHNQKIMSGISDSSQELQNSIGKISENIKDSTTLTINKHKEIQHEFEQIQTRLHQTFEELMRKNISENTKLMQRLEEESKNALKITGESVTKQLELIDQSMQNEVNRVMNEMGNALATITHKFTTDYQQLVNEMQNIISYRGNRN